VTNAPKLLFDRTPISNVVDLISKFSNNALASPCRSTVPLLALAKDDWPTFAKVLTSCGLSGDLSLAFEQTVRSPKGEGRASHSDAMAISATYALAIEAKWTEPRYESVAARLKRKDSNGGSREFVEGWLELLQPHSTRALNLDNVATCVYQVLHRSASACGLDGRSPRLAYLHFTPALPSAATSAQYLSDLSDVHSLLGNPDRFPFFLVELPLLPTAAFRRIEGLKKGEVATGSMVREVLLSDVLFEFGEPQVRRIVAGRR
jgi:hypothetical protein